MPWTDLPTNFGNLIWTGLKKFRQHNNEDNTVSFEDVTEYSGSNTQMSADVLNQMTGALNDIMNGNVFYTESEVDTLLAGKANSSHAHDDRYYTEEEVDTLLLNKADADDVYTKQETDAALADKADSDDVAEAFQLVDAALSQKADKSAVYTKQETDSALALKAEAIVCEVSGNPVSVSDASGAPVLGLSVDVAAVQSGSGDASPSNIRPISGWTGTDLTVNGASVPVSFPSSAGTVYGGTLDVTGGVLTVTHVGVDLGSLDWMYDSPYTRFSSLLPVESKDRTIRRVWYRCSCYKVISNGTSLANVPNFSTYIGFGMNELRIYVHDSRYSTVEEFQPAVLGQMIVYEIASPVTYQLTPVEVSLLLGQNVVSADCGPVSVKYYADPKLYINNNDDAVTESANAKITENIESETTATKNYTAGALAIVNNQLLRVTQNIASGGNITIGSNAEVVDLEMLFGEKAEKSLVAKLPYLSSAELYNDIAEFHNANPRGKNITPYLTDGSLWDRINGANGYSLFEDLYVGDYLTAGGQDYVIVDIDYYIRTGDSHDLTAHHLVMMPVGNMSIPEGTVLYNTDSSAEVETLQLINTVNYREYTGDSSVSVSSQETAVWKKWNASIDAPNTHTTAGGYKYSRMRQVIMKAADTIVRSAFGADHVKPIDVLYPNPADAAASGTVSSWTWFKNTDWNDDLRMSICDLPNEVQIYGTMAFALRGYEVGIDKWQFSLFRYDRRRANIRSYWWLRSVHSATSACFVNTYGAGYASGSSGAFGVRPRFLLVG